MKQILLFCIILRFVISHFLEIFPANILLHGLLQPMDEA